MMELLLGLVLGVPTGMLIEAVLHRLAHSHARR